MTQVTQISSLPCGVMPVERKEDVPVGASLSGRWNFSGFYPFWSLCILPWKNSHFQRKIKSFWRGTLLGFFSVQENFSLSLGSCSHKIPSVTSEIEITNKRNFAMILMWILWTKKVYLWNLHLPKGLFKCFFQSTEGGFRFDSWTPHFGMPKTISKIVFLRIKSYMTIRTHICPFTPGIKDECPRHFLVQFRLKLLYNVYSSQIKPTTSLPESSPTWHFQRVLRSAARSWQMSMSGALHFSFPTSWGTVGFRVDGWVGWLVGVDWLVSHPKCEKMFEHFSNKENINPFNIMKFLSNKHTWLHNSLCSHRHIYMIHFVAFPFLTSKRTYQKNLLDQRPKLPSHTPSKNRHKRQNVVQLGFTKKRPNFFTLRFRCTFDLNTP